MSFYTSAMAKLDEEVEQLEDALRYCSNLRNQDALFGSALSSFASGMTSAIKFEDAGSVANSASRLNQGNDQLISIIESECRARIAKCRTEHSRYGRLEKQRLENERLQSEGE